MLVEMRESTKCTFPSLSGVNSWNLGTILAPGRKSGVKRGLNNGRKEEEGNQVEGKWEKKGKTRKHEWGK